MDACSRAVPSWAISLLRRFGNNQFGKPLYRVIWSEDRIRYAIGGYRRPYGEGRNRWMVEKWCGPAIYGSRESWEALREPDGSSSLGPYPNEGDYEWVYTFETPEGEGVPLDPGILELLCRCIEQGKLLTDTQRKLAIDARRTQEEKARDQRFADAFDDSLGPFGGQPVAGIPSKRLPDDVVIREVPKLHNHGSFSQAG